MAMVPAYAARGLAMRAAGLAFRGARAPRYKLPSWLRYANMAAAYSAGKTFLKDTRSARARASSITKSVFKKSRKKLQGKARAKKIADKRGPVPKTPSSRVPAKYAVAPSMTKFKKATHKNDKRMPKSAIVHYKEYGEFTGNQVMYINHEHIGSVKKFWMGIGLGLSKALLAKARVYPNKSIDDPMIGPRTNYDGEHNQYDDKSVVATLRLIFSYGGTADKGGQIGKLFKDVPIEDLTPSPDVYRTFSAIAAEVANELMQAYYTTAIDNISLNGGMYLSAAQIYMNTTSLPNAVPIYINNLDDAEIHLYVNSMIKLQNITLADHGYFESNAHGTTVNENARADQLDAYSKSAIDANPLIGRIYSAKGLCPDIDTELGNGLLDTYFQQRHEAGFTLCGYGGSMVGSDMQKVAHIPTAKEIYGPQSVTTGHISMPPGSMKFHKTTFRIVKTFKDLSKYMIPYDKLATGYEFPTHIRHAFRHTLFGLKCAHKHGADKIRVGYNRDIDVGCYVKINRKLFPIKAAYADDRGITSVSVAPTETLVEPYTMGDAG